MRGASQLRQIFGIAEQGAQDFQQYADQQFQKTTQAAADQGALDQARGQIDAEQMAHSHAYAKAVSGLCALSSGDSGQLKPPLLPQKSEVAGVRTRKARSPIGAGRGTMGPVAGRLHALHAPGGLPSGTICRGSKRSP